jgi:cytidylate kinase
MERDKVDEETARKIITKTDSSRSSFYNYYTGKKWGMADSYDLCINTSILGLDETAKFLADFIRKR